ncbi:MAG: undecaprenyl-phosphate glucose phosphotransferase [Phycisphaerales bacterium]
MLKQQHQFFVALFALLDGVVVAGACFLAWLLRMLLVEGYLPPFPGQWESWVKGPRFIVEVPIVLFAMSLVGLYRPRRDRTLWSEQVDILKVSIVAVAGMVLVLWAIGRDSTVTGVVGRQSLSPAPHIELFGQVVDGGRVQIGLLALLLPALLGLHRASFRLVLRHVRKRGRNLRHVAIIGVGRLGQIVHRTLGRNSWTGINVAYFVSHHNQTKRTACQGAPVLGGLEGLEGILQRARVDAVYLAIPNAQAAEMPRILQVLDKFALDVRIVPDVHPRFVPQSMAISELDGMPILSYRECPSTGLGGLTKRALDVVGAAGALMAFAPLLLLAAGAVRFSSSGPVIFKQKRVSLGGKVFKIYKFRTMYDVHDEENGAAFAHLRNDWTQRDDPRITPVGRWLRRTSVDELPQLLNVLKGQMSLVGPRPERPELIERFREDWRGYMLRQHVKAGMTGWAQVNGLRGHTSLRKRLQYDLFYVRHWSLWFDLRILWLTVFRGFVHRNAH